MLQIGCKRSSDVRLRSLGYKYICWTFSQLVKHQPGTWNWTYTRYAKCHVVMSMDIPDDRDRTDTLAQRLREKKQKEINCFILHCIGLDFKYGGSVCLETTENTLQRWQTEVLGEPCVPSQLLHGFCISCGVQDKHPRTSVTATPVKKTAILLCSTRKRYRLRIPLTLLSLWIFMETKGL